ncbi:hypothetical protein BaRGS_00031076, partial [Batillaria attramentaria]
MNCQLLPFQDCTLLRSRLQQWFSPRLSYVARVPRGEKSLEDRARERSPEMPEQSAVVINCVVPDEEVDGMMLQIEIQG